MTPNILTTTGSWVKGAATIAALLLLASSLRAQDVTLRSVLGDLVVEGTFLGFDGDYIRVETPAGELTLNYGKVECSGAACPDPETHVERLRFAGTSRIGELILPALVEGFARSRNQRVEREEMEGRAVYSVLGRVNEPDVRVEIHLTTTEDGFAAIRARDADVAMAVGAVRSVDDRSATERQSGVSGDTRRIRIIAYDAVVPIVSPGSRIRPLSLSDLSHLFAGEIGNWSRLGGPNATPRLHLGNPETGLAQFFVERVLSATGRSLTDRAVRHDSDRDIVDAVMDDPAAIGLVSFERIENAISLPLLGRCGLSDRATLDTVKTGDFPLTVPLYLHLPAHRLGPFGRAFVVWMSGPDAHRILRRIGVPGPMASPIPVGIQGDRIVAAIQRAGDELGLGPLLTLADAIEGRERLTPTFRFQVGQRQLNRTSQAQVRAVARAIRDGRYIGNRLFLLGFSDSVGSASTNLILSEERAEAVRDAILQQLGGSLPQDQVLDTIGLGEVLPVTCDDTAWGRDVNRRVELWATVRP